MQSIPDITQSWWGWREFLGLARNTLDTYASYRDLYHPAVSFRFAGTRHVFFYRPEAVSEVLRHSDFCRYPPLIRVLRQVIGESVTSEEGDVWRARRRAIAPLTKSQGQSQTIRSVIESVWNGPETFLVMPRMADLAMRLFCACVLNYFPPRARDQEILRFGLDLEYLGRCAMIELFLPDGLPQWLPWPWVRSKRRAISRLKAFVQGLPVQLELPFDEVLNLMLAGHETTASAMSWMLYLLAQHPGDCERCASDLDYCEKVARETLRLYPPAPAVFLRQAQRDLSIDGYFLPKGSVVHLSSWAIQRDPLLWEKPAEFWPERPHPSHPQSYFPFGYGARSCLGQGLALLEMSHLSHWLCQNFHLSTPAQVARTEMRFSLWPGWPLQIRLSSR